MKRCALLASFLCWGALTGLSAQTPLPSTTTAGATTTATQGAAQTLDLAVAPAEPKTALPKLSPTEQLFARIIGSESPPLYQYGYAATQPVETTSLPSTATSVSNQAGAPAAATLSLAQGPSLPSRAGASGASAGSGSLAGNLVGTNVSPNYTLGPGDQLTLMVWGDPVDLGDLQPLVQLEVNRSGGVFFAPVGLVPVAGLALGDVEKTLFAGLAKKYKKFDLRLALGQLRQFPVTVTGFVNRPGQVSATAAFGPFELLQAAGGVAKNGSLRSLVLRTREGKTRAIDLYPALLGGIIPELGLHEGDTLNVLPLGITVGLSGAVNRPGIYEALPGETLGDLLKMGGGGTADGQSEGLRLSELVEGRVRVSQGALADAGFVAMPLKSGMLLDVMSATLAVVNGVLVEGHVQNPGWFALPASGKLSDLLPKLGFQSDTELSQAQLIHTNPQTLELSVVGFRPLSIFSGAENLELASGDRLRFFESQALSQVLVAGEVERPTVVPWKSGLTFEDVLAQVRLKGDPRLLVAQIRDGKTTQQIFLRDRLTRRPGASIPIPSGASVQFIPLPSGLQLDSVLIVGAVKAPGAYRLTPGMRLSDLVSEAGGVTEKGTLSALVFQRASVLENQQTQMDNIARTLEGQITDLQAQVLAATDPQSRAAAQAQLEAKKAALELYHTGLQDSVGRISLSLSDDQALLATNNQNLNLEPGDRVYVPTRPEFVSVLGAVYNQSTQAFVAGKTVGEALSQAGGVIDSGNVDGAYVIRSNGLVENAAKYRVLFFWSTFGLLPLLPGDSLVVPSKDPNTVDAWTITKESIQILGSTVALTANSLAIMKTLGAIK